MPSIKRKPRNAFSMLEPRLLRRLRCWARCPGSRSAMAAGWRSPAGTVRLKWGRGAFRPHVLDFTTKFTSAAAAPLRRGLYVCRSRSSPPKAWRRSTSVSTAVGKSWSPHLRGRIAGLYFCRSSTAPPRAAAKPPPHGGVAQLVFDPDGCRCLFISEPGPLACTSVIAAPLRRGRPPTSTAHPTGAWRSSTSVPTAVPKSWSPWRAQ